MDQVLGLTSEDWQAIFLTFRLATVVTLILLVVATPVAWWLTTTQSKLKPVIGAIVALPLVLPPTVIGFYLLIAMGPNGPVGEFTQSLGIGTLPFTFTGLVVASIIYSFPFVVQPIQNSLEALGKRPLEVAATLRASRFDTFFTVVLPLAKPGFITATILGFAHTVGEFGVILMIGGNIPGETQVISVLIYEHVESLQYAQAHSLSAAMIIFSFIILLLLYGFNQKQKAIRVIN
ncbi:Molybdate ABC transporter, inner membrane subunit [Oleispira antarctica RB-8]|uniref:Molybdenum transport system permease n=1 Tax=Oleispira antarctica RB-8 TaxID=698738 RepID=R4YQ50_OLEAN|nr:Molybdate ABC transporter, inner membrane subunit [Oleispira antarctica RB-8]